MRIFVTGAAGWIGSAVVPELLDAGHQVVGLARSDATADALTRAGAEVVRGDLDDLDGLRTAAAASDGVIHLAFKHDVAFSGGFLEAAQSDRQAVEAFGSALAGSDRPLLIASGTMGIAPGRVATESDGQATAVDDGDTGFAGGPNVRLATAQRVVAMADDGVRSVVVRLPPTVHGEGDTGFMAALVASARRRGAAGFLGDGANRWPAVHRLDAARLFRAALEGAPAGSTLHAVAEEGVPIRAVAEAIGRGLDVPVQPVAPEDAADQLGFLAAFLGVDSPASSARTRELLDWTPTGPGLLDDLDAGHYTDS